MVYLRTIKNYLANVPGWHSNRKIVVIESDDWGSIRMPGRKVYDHLLKKGLNVDKDPYTRFDSLESNDDLIALFSVLESVKDVNKRSAVMTANCIVANPDFEAIKNNDFQNYEYENRTETLKRYPNHDQVISLYNEGMNAGVFIPQLHGREHLNVKQWMEAIRNRNGKEQIAFNYQVLGANNPSEFTKRNNFMAALDYDEAEDQDGLVEIIKDAGRIFEAEMGYISKTFIAPCYIWGGRKIENSLKEIGVKAFQGIAIQYLPEPGKTLFKKRFRYLGQKNKFGQIQLVRNAFFEPALLPNQDSVSICMKRIEIAFACRKPAIIGSHRLNYIGGIHVENRDKNLAQLGKLLKSITIKWPEVSFMSSDELYSYMISENKNA